MKFDSHGAALLAFGSRDDIGGWELHVKPEVHLGIFYSGFRTPNLFNLSELVQDTLAENARKTGRLQLPDSFEKSSNVLVFQINTKILSKWDIAFLSGTGSRSSRVEERLNCLTGTMLTSQLGGRRKNFKVKTDKVFNLHGKIDSNSRLVSRVALGNLLGSIGYFYGKSKIAIPRLNNDAKVISYWPAELYTAVPSRSSFPMGFLWDEGFHQLLIWHWDANICMDIIGHWLDLINIDGWIPRQQILGAEALSKVPEEFIPQHPTDGNPPTFFLTLLDLANDMKTDKFSAKEANEIFYFLERAYVRLEAWFNWFNTTQSGKVQSTFFWHGRDNTTNMELNPKTLSSGLDDYPRASHPNEDERHIDLRCWMLLAARCIHSIGELLGKSGPTIKAYQWMAEELSNFDLLNKIHFDDIYGAYFDFGNNTEKVELRWQNVEVDHHVERELVRVTLEKPHLSLVPHVGYVSLFPFIMAIIPPASPILEMQLELISNRSTLWTDYGLCSLSKKSSLYMKYNTENDAPYWRGPIWINMNYMILSGLHHYSLEDGPYRTRARGIYQALRLNLISNVVRNYEETGFLWEHYDQVKGLGEGAHPFSGWTSLVTLTMAEYYPNLGGISRSVF